MTTFETALLGACRKMLKLTGGSQYWTGKTEEALQQMEAAVKLADSEADDESIKQTIWPLPMHIHDVAIAVIEAKASAQV
jgi:hypothetical protein